MGYGDISPKWRFYDGRQLVPDFARVGRRLIAQSKIERESPGNLPVVLAVKPEIPLAESPEGIGLRIPGTVRQDPVERKRAALQEQRKTLKRPAAVPGHRRPYVGLHSF